MITVPSVVADGAGDGSEPGGGHRRICRELEIFTQWK